MLLYQREQGSGRSCGLCLALLPFFQGTARGVQAAGKDFLRHVEVIADVAHARCGDDQGFSWWHGGRAQRYFPGAVLFDGRDGVS